ncbi:MAG TPA: hypothetical protein VKT28_12195 [Puia sp.]|nr:hypothetical protein [Puia sp.]
MPERNGAHIIQALRNKWEMQAIIFYLLLFISVSIIITGLLHYFFQMKLWWGIFPLLIEIGFFLFFSSIWRIKKIQIARLLNQSFPELEESCGLVLLPAQSMSLLENLQKRKVETVLKQIDLPKPFNKKLVSSFLIFVVSCFMFFGLYTNAYHSTQNKSSDTSESQESIPEKMLPQIKNISIQIIPPSYTHKKTVEQNQFDIKAEEGANIRWQIIANEPLKKCEIIFNDSSVLRLTTDKEQTAWSISRLFNSSSFYQLKINDKLFDLHKIEIIKDEPPVINIQSPKPYTTIDYGEPEKALLHVFLKDDYGIKNVGIVATVASGNGEAVQFKQVQLSFDNSFSENNPYYDLAKTINLASFGMKPGDELYFYVKAEDTHAQEARSDMYIISLPDTAQLMSLDGLTMGLDIKPEYFRSERQIIIETEQLLKEKDTISVQSFHDRSNNLGIDQKILRLRYGKFLGEEGEENIGDSKTAPNAGNASSTNDFGNAASILDQFTDKHDNAEDATFFSPEIKQQLKATLTEMWNAELRLRTFQTREALPYEYKALRLLKDLQQKSRAFVAKTGVKTTPLNQDKRLSGDLSKIIEPEKKYTKEIMQEPDDVSRTAISILEELKSNSLINPPSLIILQQSAQNIGKAASGSPSQYLASYQALKKIIASLNEKKLFPDNDIVLAQQGLQKMIAPATLSLKPTKTNGELNLAQQYFKNLKSKKD